MSVGRCNQLRCEIAGGLAHCPDPSEALALPAAAVIIVLLFRREFRQLVPLVRKLKAGPLEAEFERDIREISREAGGATTLKSNMSLTRLSRNPRKNSFLSVTYLTLLNGFLNDPP